ncbi:transcriptional regulator GcvA [Methylobacterium sp. J-070]|uniref:transcriptional regulator GcvA n=1 Tax=Methylobacterium sp. J-070 TaxID=2836650 RepID=UPI001FB9BE1D|nr:transcriptional regulator GcvA [Methylobacterium sp. J-070]MCJ2052901.1 transcriptional regulator GcvA [Methylobacterium sp. J-070]
MTTVPMTWTLPSLSSLRVFEAAGRHMSFTRAALELHITQSAVSHQIRTLEDHLGVHLFERSARGIALTPAGAGYLRDIRNSLNRIQEATLKLLTEPTGGMLNVATPPAFGARWLIPRLDRFRRANSDILITLVTRSSIFDFAQEKLDAAIHYGHNDWPDVTSEPLVGAQVVLIAAPRYLRSLGGIKDPADLARATLLQHIRKPDSWRRWLEAIGAQHVNAWAGPRFEHFYMIIQAAIAGLGVGLVPRVIAADDIESGQLVVPFQTDYVSDQNYCLVYPDSKIYDMRLNRFRSWLSEEARAYNLNF